MKIIITVNTYYPLKDGVQFVTQYLAEGLIKKGHKVVVITSVSECEGVLSEENYNGVSIYRVDAKVVHTFNKGEKLKIQQLIMELTKDSDALINVCTQTALTDWTYPLLEKIKCKKVLYMHGIMDLHLKKTDFTSMKNIAHRIWNIIRYSVYYSMNKKYMHRYDEITQLHQYDPGNLFFKRKYGIKSNIIENAAADSFFELNIGNDIKELPSEYFLCVANYIDRKNQKMIIEAFYKAKIPSNIYLILIGSEKTKYYNELESYNKFCAEKYGNRPVQMLTQIPREYIVEYTQRAKVYLLGSKWEAFPISIIEAMATGTPYISTDVGIVKYLPGGVIVNSTEEMTYWMELLVNNEYMCDMLGKIGNEYAKEHLSVDKKIEQLEKLLEK